MATLHPEFTQADVEILATQPCHAGFLRVEKIKLRYRLFAGGWSDPVQRELLIKDQAVGVLLYDPDREEVVLVRQFRIGIQDKRASPWLLELVAGMVSAGESPLQVATRESIEEANCEPADLLKICDYYNSPGTSNEKLTLYCGRVNAPSLGGIHGLDEEHEDIEVVVLGLQTAIEAVNSGVINNAMTIIALQWLQLHKPRILDTWGRSP